MASKHGILVISHGSSDAQWVETVEQLVYAAQLQWIQSSSTDDVRHMREQTPVYCAYLELVEGKLIQDGVTSLEAKGVTTIHVMPLFVSHGSSHLEEIKQSFGFTPCTDFIGDLPPISRSANVIFDEPIGAEREIIEIVKEQVAALRNKQEHNEADLLTRDQLHMQAESGIEAEASLADDVHAHDEALLLLGHGSSMSYFYQKWEQGMNDIASTLQQEIDIDHIAIAPLLPERSREALESLLTAYKKVIVIPLFISPGYFTRVVIPNRLKGLPYQYSGQTFLPSEHVCELLVRRFSSYPLEEE